MTGTLASPSGTPTGRQDRERRYIAEFMAITYPEGNYSLNVPLGPIPQEILSQHGLSAGAALYRPARPRVDATRWTKRAYFLYEAKIREAKAAIGDLLVYKALADNTPDMPGYEGQEIHLVLVVPWALDWIQQAAFAHGMDLQIYLPAWVESYVRERQNMFTRDARIAREEKIRLRKQFGLE